MMNKKYAAALLGLSAGFSLYAAEPVVMTVNGNNVPKSEFEYLYHKNNQQQNLVQPIEEYVEMFKLYKLKVEDAKSMGIDTTENFKREMAQYKRELANPYMADTVFVAEMVGEAFNRSQLEIEASLIKITKPRNPQAIVKTRMLADSLQQAIKEGADFAEIAKLYSSDVAAPEGGYHGYMTIGRLPFQFEEALYTTPEGGVSEIIEFPDSYYLLTTGKHRPSRGKVEVSHILKMVPPTASEADKLLAKQQIDSIYLELTKPGANFGEIAKSFSDDKASAKQEGRLPVFGAGEMIPEFEAVAFEIKPGEVSAPFQSKFGWHIMKKTRDVGLPSRDEIKEFINQRIANPQDARYRLVKDHEISNLVKKYNGKIDEKGLSEMQRQARIAGLDSMYLANWTTMPLSETKIAQVGNKTLTAGELLSQSKRLKGTDAEMAPEVLGEMAFRALGLKAIEVEEEELYANVPEYRNLLDEYEDGSLLYEVSVLKVWDKASKDTEGLNDFFNQHRAEYAWTAPRVKGILVQTVNDSISNLVRERLQQNGIDNESLGNIRKEFANKAVIERVVAEQGVNPIVDFLVFNGAPAKPKNANFTNMFMFEPRIIEAPEELEDVKSRVITDYQNYLEEEWKQELVAKYPVTIYLDEILKIK